MIKGGDYTITPETKVITNNDHTLYATWEENEVNSVKYAVQIYGINQDEDADGNTLGLTFGPATGGNYNNSYVTHEYEEITGNPGNYYVKVVTHNIDENGNDTPSSTYLKNSSNNNVIRTAEEKEKYDVNLHEMSWAEIKAVPDMTVFRDCMLCGDTKSVRLSLNDTIKTTAEYNQYGDGAGTLVDSIDDYYRIWNPSYNQNTAASNAGYYGANAKLDGGYSTSHIRATLIGVNDKTNITYAGDVNLNSTTSVYSCIEGDLRAVITPKKIKYITGSSKSSCSLNDDIADSIWLFSDREIYEKGQLNGITIEGIGTNGVGYNRFSDTESKYYMSSYNNDSTNKRVCYREDGTANNCWLRTPYLENTDQSELVGDSGYISSNTPRSIGGLSFGFCITNVGN